MVSGMVLACTRYLLLEKGCKEIGGCNGRIGRARIAWMVWIRLV